MATKEAMVTAQLMAEREAQVCSVQTTLDGGIFASLTGHLASWSPALI